VDIKKRKKPQSVPCEEIGTFFVWNARDFWILNRKGHVNKLRYNV